MSRIQDKIAEIQEYLDELDEVLPEDFREYMQNLERRLATERAFEKIIEATNDLAILFLKHKRFELPGEDIRAFDIIAKKGLISSKLAISLRQAKGMRNFLAHQYDKIDDELVFNAITNRLSDDVNDFICSVEKEIKEEG